jgi:hypothetical protein
MYNRQHLTRTLVAAAALTVATIGAWGGPASADGHRGPNEGHAPRAHRYHLVDHATGRIGLPVTEFTLTGHGFSNLQGRTSSVFIHNASGESVTVSSEDGDSVHMMIGASLLTTDVICPVGAFPARSINTIVGGTGRFANATGSAISTACNSFSDVTPDGVTLNGIVDVVGTIIF